MIEQNKEKDNKFSWRDRLSTARTITQHTCAALLQKFTILDTELGSASNHIVYNN